MDPKLRFLTGVLVLAFLFLVSFSAGAVKVDAEVQKQLQDNDEVSVVIIMKDDLNSSSPNLQERRDSIQKKQGQALGTLRLEDTINIKGETEQEREFELERTYSTVNALSGKVTQEGLDKLKNNPLIDQIVFNSVFHTSLDVSVPQINADEVQNISVNGANLRGNAETICVLDTGIDTDHSAFTGRILNQYCYCQVSDLGAGGCCPDNSTEDSSAEDDNGHGTHVTGIAAGNHSAYRGVAPAAGIISIKVCDNAGLCNLNDVISGIDWCTNNVSIYNISVISMSLGDGTQNNAYCNSHSTASSINAAWAQNISVVISSGNDGYTAGISAPACVQNATPVGAVNDNDAITYNRGTILDILAPGVGIIAPTNDGSTGSKSGTSMSTPHVSGALTLFRQYWRLAYGQVPNPDVIERKVALTGALIVDSGSGKNYSRLDILAAIQPYINFTSNSQTNGSTVGVTHALINITTDVNITTALLEWDHGNDTIENITMTQNNVSNYFYNITGLRTGTHTYKVYGNDSANTLGTSKTRTLSVDSTPPNVLAINSPAANANLSSGLEVFNATVNDTHSNVSQVQFNLTNGSSFVLLNASTSGSDDNYWNASFNVSTLAEEIHRVTVVANDTLGNINSTVSVNFTVDRTSPTLNLETSNATNTSDTTPDFMFNFSDNLFTTANCTLLVDGSKTGSNASARNGTSTTLTSSSVADGNHNWSVNCSDGSGNQGQSTTFSLTVDGTAPAVTSFNSPVENANLTTGMQVFNVTVSDATIGLASVQFNITNGSSFIVRNTSTTGGNYWNASLDITALAEEVHTFTVLANDTLGNLNNSQSINFTVDITDPAISSISSGTPTSSGATITWTTNEAANSSVNYGTSSALGTVGKDSALVTLHSLTLSSLSASTTYSYNVTSCDVAGNCNTTGPTNFTTAASSGGDSGGGGGGGGSTISAAVESAAAESPAVSPVESSPAAAPSGGVSAAGAELATEEAAIPTSIHLTSQESTVVKQKDGGSVKEVSITSAVDKETNFEISYLTEKPENLPDVSGRYQFFEISTDLTEQDITKALLTFTVPKSWLAEHQYDPRTVRLNTFSDGKWKLLPTKKTAEGEVEYVYQSELKHFSYFAITASPASSNIFGKAIDFMGEIIPARLSLAGLVLLGTIVIIILLLLAYWYLRKRED